MRDRGVVLILECDLLAELRRAALEVVQATENVLTAWYGTVEVRWYGNTI